MEQAAAFYQVTHRYVHALNRILKRKYLTSCSIILSTIRHVS